MLRAALSMLLVATALPAYAQAPGQSIAVGDWKIANSKNAAGVQTCLASTDFEDKSMVGFSGANDGGTSFFFQEPQAKLKDGAQYPASFQIDKNVAVTGTGIAVSPVMLVVPLTDPDTVFKQLAAGDNLSVTVAGQSFDEPLVGSQNAITALASCVTAAVANK